MPLTTEVTIVHVIWRGPRSYEEVIAHVGGDHPTGVYQIYGTHPVSGPDTLLYLGKTESSFAMRVPGHTWIEWEPTPVSVYLGQIDGIDAVSERERAELVNRIERLLLYFCPPAYNSAGLSQNAAHAIGEYPLTVVMNFGRRHRLPWAITNLGERILPTTPQPW